MSVGDTSLGGSRRDFPETVLDVVRRASDASPDIQRVGLEDLCKRYWKPAYHYFRVTWAKSNEDAKDLAQSFFLWIAEPGVLKRFDPERGGFRAFLKALLRHFVQHHDEALGRLKRGGGRALLTLNEEVAPVLTDPRVPGPADAFEADWRRSVIDQAVEAVRERLRSESKGVKFELFELYYLAGGLERPTYDALAKRFGLKPGEVQHYLADVRAEVRLQIRAQIAESASGPGELEEEWNAFFGS
jgi:RNA polymerase sigma-70 factor (ECF subfamily)